MIIAFPTWSGDDGMDSGTRFRVLGPLEIETDGRPVRVPAGKHRVLVAAMLLRANRTVSIDDLIEKLWDRDVPADARGTVQKYVMRIRRALGADSRITTEPGGYRFEVRPGQLDLEQFRELVHRADVAHAAGDLGAEFECLTEASELWRDMPPLSNVPSDSMQRAEVPELVERYLRTTERRINVGLVLDQHAELTAELMHLVRGHPLREQFWVQLMRALHGAGRQGDALIAYRDAARVLSEELGVDPGVELLAAHREILLGDAAPPAGPAAPVGAPADTAGASWQPVRQLPMASAGFVGRHTEIAEIAELLANAARPEADRRGSPPLVVVTGPAGAGKTTLVVHAAHQVADQFADGQLFADLRSHAASPARGLEEVLGQFLAVLGVAPAAVPLRFDDQILTYRSLLAGRRVLVVLDDVAGVAQVRALLPGSPGSAVLVTSRNELAGLTVSPGARPMALRMLPVEEARALLGQALGGRRAEAERAAADELVALCGGLALALRVAAAHLVLRPELRLADYVGQLRARDPVSALRVDGDESANLAAAFDWSYRQLPAPQRRLLRLISLVPGPDLTVPAAAALAGVTGWEAADGLESLAAASLVWRRPDRRYRLHDLIRGYAALRCRTDEPDAQREQARRRLFDQYIAAVDTTLAPLITVSKLPRPAPAPATTDPDTALAVLDRDRACLVAAVLDAAEHGPDDAAYHLADALRGYFGLRGHAADWRTVAEAGLRAAHRAGNEEAVAAMLNSRGSLAYYSGDAQSAGDDLGEALEIYERLGLSAASAVHANLGIVAQMSGDLESAIKHLDAAVTGHRAAGNRDLADMAQKGLVSALIDLGDLTSAQRECASLRGDATGPGGYRLLAPIAKLAQLGGDLREAASAMKDLAARAAAHGDRRTELAALIELAACYVESGHDDDAYRVAQTALERVESVDPRNARAAETKMADALRRSGRTDEARAGYRRAVHRAREAAARGQVCEALIGWAELELALGAIEAATERSVEAEALARAGMLRLQLVQALVLVAGCHRKRGELHGATSAVEEAMATARACGYPLGQGMALGELGEIRLASGDAQSATALWQQAGRLYARIGSRRAAEIDERIATVAGQS